MSSPTENRKTGGSTLSTVTSSARSWSTSPGASTQEQLAERSDLSPDTVRRIELNRGTTTVVTLTKLARGLAIRPSTLFARLEQGRSLLHLEIVDLLESRSNKEYELGSKY
ncbi:helix-turn-helix domain-containing protein [Enhygromyxa salina]|uniref:helix-turn-helix domain-containing protein n=1 Tax=Enhygromyxa salina TaxID=215803 RepID=UPI0015E6000A